MDDVIYEYEAMLKEEIDRIFSQPSVMRMEGEKDGEFLVRVIDELNTKKQTVDRSG